MAARTYADDRDARVYRVLDGSTDLGTQWVHDLLARVVKGQRRSVLADLAGRLAARALIPSFTPAIRRYRCP